MGFFNNLFRRKKDEVVRLLQQGAVIIDVRSPLEFAGGHINGAYNIPLDTLSKRITEIRQMKKPVITVCQSGMRSSTAAFVLEKNGILAKNGGAWRKIKQLLETKH